MAFFISVCKQVIQSNNKRGWIDPDPAIRIGKTVSGPATARGHTVHIMDREGRKVATILSSTDGRPVLSCGAKVAIVTEHEPVVEPHEELEDGCHAG